MTDNQKAQIIKLRAAGNGYGKIAQTIGISVNTVKSFCRRNDVNGQPYLPLFSPGRQQPARIAVGRFNRSQSVRKNAFAATSVETIGGIAISTR